MEQPRFRFVCAPSALASEHAEWARVLTEEGELALMCSEGLQEVERVAHELDQLAVVVVRSERTRELQEQTVMGYAAAMPLVWVSDDFSESARAWARERGPMTLLSECDGPLDDGERRRIERFLAIIARQSE